MDGSEDSDFYGDVSTVASLRQRVDDFDVAAWARQQAAHPSVPMPSEDLPKDLSRLHNPYAGVSYAWQLQETVDQFLERLPPRTTDKSFATPWIYICNPYLPRVKKNDSVMSQGNEDEGPQEEGSKLEIVLEGGMERLGIIATLAEGLRKTGKPVAMIEKDIEKERKQAWADLLHLAHLAKVRTGKWMLFCPAAEVSEVWSVVAKATANNELGIAAKVAPKPLDHTMQQDRLICVYTADFADKPDVERVLQKLRELRLVENRTQRIYYKPDVFTHMGIARGNPWGLKASIYSSTDKFEGPLRP